MNLSPPLGGSAPGVGNLRPRNPPFHRRMARAKFRIAGMDCATCTRILENALKREPGVNDVVANYMIDAAVVDYDPAKTDEETLRKAAEPRTTYRLRRLR